MPASLNLSKIVGKKYVVSSEDVFFVSNVSLLLSIEIPNDAIFVMSIDVVTSPDKFLDMPPAVYRRIRFPFGPMRRYSKPNLKGRRFSNNETSKLDLDKLEIEYDRSSMDDLEDSRYFS